MVLAYRKEQGFLRGGVAVKHPKDREPGGRRWLLKSFLSSAVWRRST